MEKLHSKDVRLYAALLADWLGTYLASKDLRLRFKCKDYKIVYLVVNNARLHSEEEIHI